MPKATAAGTAEIMRLGRPARHRHARHLDGAAVPTNAGAANKLDVRAEPRIVKETPVSVLIDGGGGLGHPATERARHGDRHREGEEDRHRRGGGAQLGPLRRLRFLCAAGGRRRLHRHGRDLGERHQQWRRPTARKPASAPIRSPSPPPGKPGEPFLLDMATTTVAAGKIRNKANEKLQTPTGWLVTKDGAPSTDPHEVSKGGFMTPLGGTPEGSSHKGYGLGAMVNILSSALVGRPDGDGADAQHAAGPDRHRPLLPRDGSRHVPRHCATSRPTSRPFCDTLRATRSGRSGQAGAGRGRSRAPHRRGAR